MSLLDTWDYVSMSVLVALTCAVGLYQAFKVNADEIKPDFLVANRELSVFSLTMSMAATIASAAFMSGYAMEVYTQGLILLLLCPTIIAGVIISAQIFLPVFYQLNNHTVFQLLVTSVFLYAISLILVLVTTLELWAAVCLIGISCTVYTSLGGFKAVVWSDVAQQFIVFGVMILLVIKGLTDSENVGVIWERLEQSGRSNIFTFIPDSNTQYSFGTMIVGSFIMALFHYGINQTMIQRAISTKSLTKAKFCLIGGASVFVVCLLLIIFCGAIIAARYVGCDPQITGVVKSRDQMLMLFAVDTLSFCKGLTGVFLAGLICATISSVSSYLNSLAAITMSDYIRPLYPNLTITSAFRLSKIITFIYGAVIMVLVAPMHKLGGLLRLIFSVSSVVNAPTATIFTIGMLLPWVNTKAAIAGTAASVVLPWWAIVGGFISSAHPPHLPYRVSECSNLTDVVYNSTQVSSLHKFYTMSPLWYISWSVTVGLAVSLIAGKIIGFQDSSKVDPLLLFPFVRRYVKPRHVTEEEEIKLNNEQEAINGKQ